MEPPLLPAAPGVIRADEAYRLDEFKRRMGMNDDAMRKAKRQGLRPRKSGRRKFIIGDEAIEYLRNCPEV